MRELSWYAGRPWAFLFRFVVSRPIAHSVIFGSVVAAVACSVSTQYGVKALVDALAAGPGGDRVWWALALLVGFIAADNVLWRVASLVAAFTFVRTTGDVRKDLLRHLTGHAPSFFTDRQPGTLASRVTATSNAFFQLENMAMWNVLPPCVAATCAIMFIGAVSVPMALTMASVCAVLILVMFRLASAGKPLHHDFADKAAAVDGEMVDVVSNMTLVKSFGGLKREFLRFDGTIGREMAARRSSLLYLERLRILHAITVVVGIISLLLWVVGMWQAGQATAGQVVLVCTLGITILSTTRDLAVALVDATQHVARFSEALETLLVPHGLRDHDGAGTLESKQSSITFENVTFAYPDGKTICRNFDLDIKAGEWVGLVGPSGGGKSTLFQLLQRFYDVQGGRILVDGQDISKVTQESLRDCITVVPQDVSMFHRTLMENIRYGRPEATDEEVWQAAAAARCTDFIGDLPQGYDTIVGDRGVRLSGGQRQRIAIARALLKNAPILLLDEATSALDTRSEAAVREALDTLMEGRTVIAIAHRISTLRSFDRLITIDRGEVAHDGSFDQTIRREARSAEPGFSHDEAVAA